MTECRAVDSRDMAGIINFPTLHFFLRRGNAASGSLAWYARGFVRPALLNYGQFRSRKGRDNSFSFMSMSKVLFLCSPNGHWVVLLAHNAVHHLTIWHTSKLVNFITPRPWPLIDSICQSEVALLHRVLPQHFGVRGTRITQSCRC
jgi:hypothetical protein